jgi:phosphoribosylaminoimidazole-succinocarboxamide synthase
MLTRKELLEAAEAALQRVDLAALPELGARSEGKVRDMWVMGDRRVLVTTDRVSAFDRVLGTIPFKGQVLNQLSAWWFEQVQDLVESHVVAVPDPNVTIAREAAPLPVEVIVRGYITGVTSTALWTLYQQGVERPYGLDLPPGLQKDDPLPAPVVTPTTKATGGAHDERLTPGEIVERGLVPAPLWAEVERVALELFRRGQDVARRAGLILVDTKYEFGLVRDSNGDGALALIDEVHTPDSSRYWVAESWARARAEGGEPEQFDKEVLRKWFVARGYRGEGEAPALPAEFRAEVAERYVAAFERLTGRAFEPGAQPAAERIERALREWLVQQA